MEVYRLNAVSYRYCGLHNLNLTLLFIQYILFY